MIRKLFLLLLPLFLTGLPAITQELDTIGIFPDTLSTDNIPDSLIRNDLLDSSRVYFFHNYFETMGPEFIEEIDTFITNVENYDPPTRPGNYYATLGNPGLAHKSMVYNPAIKSGFNFGINAFEKYLFNNDSIHHYWVGRPYTHLFFIQGAKKEQNLHVDHSQNVSSWFNLGLQFDYVNSPGYYQNQEADDKNFVFKTRFQTRDYRYMVLANYIHNKLRIEENGGIVYDTVFEENTSPDRRGIEVNLYNANNSYKENIYYVKQFFKLSKRHRFRSEEDTTQYTSFFDKLNPGNISHAILLNQRTYLYQQPTSDNNGFYPNTYDSINGTYDSTHIFSIENQFSWTNTDNSKKQLLTFNFMVRHLYTEYSVDSTRNIYNQLIPTAQVKFRVSDVLKVGFFGDFVTGNSNAGDFNLLGNLTLSTKFGTLRYELQNANQEPGKFYSAYRSNHFRWQNDFSKLYFFINRASLTYQTFTGGFSLFAIENFVYMNAEGLPDQLNSNLQVLQVHARKLFRLGNFGIDLRAIYQKASNVEGIRVPELLGDGSFYFTKDLFKQAAILQTGFDVFYNTAYYAYGYIPALRSFQIQDEKEVGNYVYANAFLNLQIKRARLFVKYHNLGFLLKDYRYYTVPTYPMRDGGIRFGVSWMFYD
jgi:hypothetical protein